VSRHDDPTERWMQVDRLFVEALELPEPERVEWLREQCADDPDLEREVETLLAAGGASSDFLKTGAAGAIDGALDVALQGNDLESPEPPDDRVGSRIGSYRLVELIGRGGMADVYLAEREGGQFEQRVAVKIQRRGMDTDDMLRRFGAERQILSGLNHPNIARLIDGGATDDGSPYLVLEYVRGQPITDFCKHHRLSISERLDLFGQVARAVQSAHVHLVVHRDLKPSNILVNDQGQVKLLDFGIAKILDPSALPGGAPRTRTGFRPLTPEYASPEQVSGEPITTASDIYQLGLVLYRLLTGRRPFSNLENRRALEEAITETRPVKPSELIGTDGPVPAVGIDQKQLARRLRGDLDTIVLKALRKDPSRRYGSASEMADDVRRHLQGRPILARQDSRIYRGRKFLQRNTWIIPVAAGLAGATGLYIGTLIQHGNQMEFERNVAQRETAKATATQDFLVGLFQSADPFSAVSESRQDVLVTDIMDVGANRARTQFADQPELESLMLGTIGDVFLGLGDPERARSLRDEAYQIAASAFGYGSPQAALGLRRLVEPTIHSARLVAGVADSAVLIAVQAVAVARVAFGEDHLETARAEIALARAHLYSTSFPAAEPTLMHVIRKLRQSDWEASDELAEALMTLGRVLVSTASDRWPEAAVIGSEAIEMYEQSYGPEHVRTWAARVWLARTNDDPGESRRILEDAIVVFEEQLGRTHDMTIRATHALASRLVTMGEPDDAAAAYRSTLDRRAERDGTRGFWYFITARGLGDALFAAGRYEEAVQAYGEAMTAAKAGDQVFDVSGMQARRAWSRLKIGDLSGALSDARQSHQAVAESGVDSPSQYERCILALALRATGEESRADSLFAAADGAITPGHRALMVDDRNPCYGEFPGG